MTSTSPGDPGNPILAIPEPAVVREQLEKTIRETGLLRQLLRVSERAARDRTQTQEGQS